MCSEEYLIIFTGKLDDDWLVEDAFYRLLKENQSTLGFLNICHHYSDLTHLGISYILYQNKMLEEMNTHFTYKVIKLSYPEKEMRVNPQIDTLFRECVATFEEPINSALFYLIEKNGKAVFHRISRSLFHGEMEDDDHMNMNGIIVDQPDLYYRHFYHKPYTDNQIAEITKMILTIGSPMEVL